MNYRHWNQEKKEWEFVAVDPGIICQALDPDTGKVIPNGIFWRDEHPNCNPIIDKDCDEVEEGGEKDEGKNIKTKHHKHKKDND